MEPDENNPCFAMIRSYQNGDRVMDTRGLKWKETTDEKRFPLGYLKDEKGTYRYVVIFEAYWTGR